MPGPSINESSWASKEAAQRCSFLRSILYREQVLTRQHQVINWGTWEKIKWKLIFPRQHSKGSELETNKDNWKAAQDIAKKVLTSDRKCHGWEEREGRLYNLGFKIIIQPLSVLLINSFIWPIFTEHPRRSGIVASSWRSQIACQIRIDFRVFLSVVLYLVFQLLIFPELHSLLRGPSCKLRLVQFLSHSWPKLTGV